MTINSYALKDTGYANIEGNGTQETRANSGNALQINAVRVVWKRGAGTSTNPNPGSYEDTEVNFASIKNPMIVISGTIERSDSNYNSIIDALDTMCTTKGVKHFYYTSSSDGYKPITAIKGSVTHGSLQVDGSLKSLLVWVSEFRFVEKNNNPTKGVQEYELTLEVTNPKDLS